MKENWHKVLLLVSLLLLGIVAGIVGIMFPSSSQDIIGEKPDQTKGKRVVNIDAAGLQQLKDGWMKPPLWRFPENKHELFVGRRFLYYPNEKKVKLYTNDTEVFGFKIAWLEQYNLPINDPNVGLQDPDEDGFTNIMEYNRGENSTSPLDTNAHPPYISRLRVKNVKTTPYLMKFCGFQVLEGKNVYQVNVIDEKNEKHSYLRKEGEEFNGFKITHFKAIKKEILNPATNGKEKVDVDELTLHDEKIDDTFVLVVNKEIDYPSVDVDFVLSLVGESNKVISVSRGGSVDVRGAKYIFLRMDPAGSGSAMLREVATKKEIMVPAWSDTDESELPPES